MTIGSLDFLEYAVELNNDHGNSEVIRRVIVGRAYYSIFHVATDFATNDLQIDLEALECSTHARLFKGFREFSTTNPPLKSKLQALSRDLKRLHSMRVNADYHLNETVTDRHVQTMLVDAQWVAKRICELQAASAAA